MQSFHANRIIPPCFRVIALAQTRGEQTVARAELQAMVVALELRLDATIVTDCQSNIDLWISTAGGLSTTSLSTKPNADLIARLALIPRPPTQRVCKVKSHTNWYGITDSRVAFHHLGNDIADTADKRALAQIDPQVRKASDAIFKDEKYDTQQLTPVLTYCAKTTILYLQKIAESLAASQSKPAKLQKIFNWQPIAQTITIPAFSTELVEAYMWGTAFARSIEKWLALLQWPVEASSDDPGISWLELLVNWLLLSGMEIPRVLKLSTPGAKGLPKDAYSIRTSQQDQIALLQPFSWTQTTNPSKAPRVLQRRIPDQILPWQFKQNVTSLTIFGAQQKTSGFCRRPILPRQADTIQLILKDYNQGKFVLPWDFNLKNTADCPCHVQMSRDEIAEPEYDRFFRWRKYDLRKGQWH